MPRSKPGPQQVLSTDDERPDHGRRSRLRGRPVDIMHALRASRKKDPLVEVIAERLRVETDPLVYAVPFAEAIADQIRTNILDGKLPSGRPSQPLNETYAKHRGSNGPRGVRTGRTLETLKVTHGKGAFGKRWVEVTMDQPYSRGQFSHTFNGARFTYNPRDPIVAAALDELVNVILAPDEDPDYAE